MKSEISVNRIHKLDGTGAVKAFVSISINDEITIKGLRVLDGKNGLFVTMPTEKGKDGKWYNTVLPLSVEVRDTIEKIVLEAYGG